METTTSSTPRGRPFGCSHRCLKRLRVTVGFEALELRPFISSVGMMFVMPFAVILRCSPMLNPRLTAREGLACLSGLSCLPCLPATHDACLSGLSAPAKVSLHPKTSPASAAHAAAACGAAALAPSLLGPAPGVALPPPTPFGGSGESASLHSHPSMSSYDLRRVAVLDRHLTGDVACNFASVVDKRG
eukprot:7385859-Prymnesium_polylepis.1